jgi:hypothetical protein
MYEYIYIYIGLCVCVCVCVTLLFPVSYRRPDREDEIYYESYSTLLPICTVATSVNAICLVLLYSFCLCSESPFLFCKIYIYVHCTPVSQVVCHFFK